MEKNEAAFSNQSSGLSLAMLDWKANGKGQIAAGFLCTTE